jgi:predicted ATPase
LDKKFIKQLTVGGFQVFDDPVTFPLGQLTLLYGPNSAGKSAILDAMLALADLCELWTPEKTKLAPDRRSPAKILERHWRREGAMRATPADALRLGASIRIGGREWALAGFADGGDFAEMAPMYPKFAECFSCFRPLVDATEVNVEVLFQYRLAKPESPHLGHDVNVGAQSIEIGVGGAPILRWSESRGQASINLDHPALLAWKAAVDLKWLALRYKDVGEGICTHIDGWFSFAICSVTGWNLGTNAIGQLENAPGIRRSAEDSDRERGAETSFLNMFDGLFSACLRVMRDTLRVPVVPASRAVPRSSEVTFLFDAHATSLSGEPLGLLMNGLPEHQPVTRAAFISEMERCGLRRAPTGPWGETLPRSEENPVDLVNRLLSNYLFQSSGYFVAARIHALALLDSFDDAATNTMNVERKFLVTLELRDAAGRHFNFEEVGSGLGYVLPVLLAICTSDVAFLQQPELHLHPALQCELADALIVALNDVAFGGLQSKGCKQIIAETHSEHLLLRLLRRVRQTADPDRCLDPHSLGREDLVILYVDPKPDGSSIVKHLRVSEDGEFMDRWPRGFFSERDLELWDDGI